MNSSFIYSFIQRKWAIYIYYYFMWTTPPPPPPTIWLSLLCVCVFVTKNWNDLQFWIIQQTLTKSSHYILDYYCIIIINNNIITQWCNFTFAIFFFGSKISLNFNSSNISSTTIKSKRWTYKFIIFSSTNLHSFIHMDIKK